MGRIQSMPVFHDFNPEADRPLSACLGQRIALTGQVDKHFSVTVGLDILIKPRYPNQMKDPMV